MSANLSAKISIVMPAYNAQRYISEAIASVISQSCEAWELIVVDDGSTDATAARVHAFDDGRIRYIAHEMRRGVSAARNTGLDAAKGEYITFLDADDLLGKESLQARKTYLDRHPHCDVVDGIFSVVDETNTTVKRTYRPYYEGVLLPRLVAMDDRVFFNVGYFVRREAIEGVRFDEEMHYLEDLLFYLEAASRKPLRYGYVASEVYRYRQGHLSAMKNVDALIEGYRLFSKKLAKVPLTSTQRLGMRLRASRIVAAMLRQQRRYGAIPASVYRIASGR